MRDPTLYEDLRTLVGGAKRNHCCVRSFVGPSKSQKNAINHRANHDLKAIMASLYGAHQSMEKIISRRKKTHPTFGVFGVLLSGLFAFWWGIDVMYGVEIGGPFIYESLSIS